MSCLVELGFESRTAVQVRYISNIYFTHLSTQCISKGTFVKYINGVNGQWGFHPIETECPIEI